MRLTLWAIGLMAVGGLVAAEKVADVTKEKGQWPVFRGSSFQTGTAKVTLPEKLNQKWKVSTKDAIEGTPVIVNGIVYIGSYDGNLYAIKLSDGSKVWTYSAAPFISPAAWHKGRIYIGDDDGIFHCVDAKTGKKIWTYKTDAEITSGAAFTEKKVLFGNGAEELTCLSLDGKKEWIFQVEGGPVKATPTVIGNRTFVAGCDSALHVINTDNGKEVSSVELEGQVGATAAVEGDMLYIGTMTDEVLAIDWKKGKIVWRFQPKRGRQAFYASVALTDNQVIAGCRNRRIYGLDRKNGKELWSFLTRDRIEASPVVVGNRVYAASMDQRLYVLDLANKGKLLQTIELDSAVLGSPAVVEGHLVIGTEKGTVYCFGK